MSDHDSLEFPKDDDAAERRFKRFGTCDPFPDIPPALLNSADIYDYARLTGMVWPFDPDPISGKLKSASYEIEFLGDLHIVNEYGKYTITPVEHGKQYVLPSNSISFLYLKTTFRLPDYIAARFNLHISLVHAGLLLGTGPLIDPGFAGKLLIPLHNLTSVNYPLKGGEGLIWVEFTKLSPNTRWHDQYERQYERAGQYRPFPSGASGKTYQDAEKYFRKASRPGGPYPARSSIPLEVRKASTSAAKSWKAFKTLSGIGILGIIALGYSVYSLIQDANNNVASASKAISDYREYQNAILSRLDLLDEKIKVLQNATPQSNITSNNPTRRAIRRITQHSGTQHKN